MYHQAVTSFGPLLLTMATLVGRSQGADDEAIQRAVNRGVDFLRSQQRNGAWGFDGSGTAQGRPTGPGITSLAAIALLECGVGPEDPAIQSAARYVRMAVTDCDYTYSISAAIMFLDRLGQNEDIPRIELLTVRLLAGQAMDGTWGYTCPKVGEKELHRIRTALENKGAAGKAPSDRGNGDDPGQRQGRAGRQGQWTPPGGGDHSNTQFASFALWIGRKHGLPVKGALVGVQDNLRGSQAADGRWGYHNGVPPNDVNPSMICAGLIGFAVVYGLANEIALRTDPQSPGGQPSDAAKSVKRAPLQDANRDPQVRLGLMALAQVIDASLAPPAKPVENVAVGQPTPPKSLHQSQNYFLWSLERVAVAYSLQTIGNRDWYARGAELLAMTQNANGSWHNSFTGPTAETAFGLLFLRRANLAPDLTARLKGRVKDPGQVHLRAGGKDSLKESAKAAPAGRQDADPIAIRMSTELVQAPPERRQAELEKLRDAKGGVNSQALALAIPQVSGSFKNTVRDALAERLSRMTADTLRGKLKDNDPEIRRAAAVACAMKDEKGFVPDLIELLDDPEPSVSRAALAALRALTNQHLSDADQWRKWWSSQSKP